MLNSLLGIAGLHASAFVSPTYLALVTELYPFKPGSLVLRKFTSKITKQEIFLYHFSQADFKNRIHHIH